MAKQPNNDPFFPLDYDFVFKLNESDTLNLNELKHSDILTSPFKDNDQGGGKSNSTDK